MEKLKPIECTLIFFEAPQRLAQTLDEMRCVFHDRDAAVARELTKLHENVRRGNLQDLASFYANAPARGEVTVIIGPPKTEEADVGKADRLLEKALAFMPVRAAVELVSEALELPRKAVYAQALLRKQAQTNGD
jgi:16S rRNA (cytidine1402-2'-O)-methyltransferase